jgi:hypothetical protein
MVKNGLKSDGLYDWILKREGKTDVAAKTASTSKKIVW